MDKHIPVRTNQSLDLLDTEVLIAMLEYKTNVLLSISKLRLKDKRFMKLVDSEVRALQEEIKKRHFTN